jgi:spore maturation protein A
MLNFIWIALMVTAVICGFLTGHVDDVVKSVTDSAKLAFEIALGLAGIMMLWLGLMKIAEDAGIMIKLARLLKPVMTWLFPEVPPEHPAMGAMVMNMAANMLGLANAATPFGLKAMEHLATLNKNPGVATNAMCTFLAINTSSIQLIPVTAIAYLAANGATHPTDVIASALIATMCSTIAAIIAVKLFARFSFYKLKMIGETA